MSSQILHAAESTAHALSDTVDEARDRIRDFPVPKMLHHQRRRSSAPVVTAILASVLGLVAIAWWRKRSAATQGYSDGPLARGVAGRGPTDEEERAADRAEREVDIDQVAPHYQEMNRRGATVKGEGQIEPDVNTDWASSPTVAVTPSA